MFTPPICVQAPVVDTDGPTMSMHTDGPTMILHTDGQTPAGTRLPDRYDEVRTPTSIGGHWRPVGIYVHWVGYKCALVFFASP